MIVLKVLILIATILLLYESITTKEEVEQSTRMISMIYFIGVILIILL